MTNIMSKIVIGTAAAMFIYTDIADKLLVKSIQKIDQLRQEYAEIRKSSNPVEETKQKLLDEMNAKLEDAYERQSSLASIIKDAAANTADTAVSKATDTLQKIQKNVYTVKDSLEKQITESAKRYETKIKKAEFSDLFKWED